jgi:type IV secretion system protein VirD4
MPSLPVTQTNAALPVLGSSAPDAVTLGRYFSREGIGGKMRYGGELHVLVFGPNGKGKGTRLLMPNLLQMYGSSLVVVDPKGELAAVTAPFRRQLGRVVIINPFDVVRRDFAGYDDLKSAGFNPLAALDPASPSFNVEASLLADAMVTVGGKDPHWDESARAMIAAFLMYTVLEARQQRRIPTVARMRELLCEASAEPHASNDFTGMGIPKRALEMMESNIAGLRNKASQFTDWNREIQSIASTAKRHTEPFDDHQIANDLSKNGFDFRDLKREPITVYLILPPEMMARHSKWLRLVLTAAIQGVLRARNDGEPKTMFMLDEFFALGHMEIISTVWALVRGYGIQMMPILQDLNQLKKLYPDMWETFIGMAGAVASFGPNDLTTADWMSRRAGETTRVVMNYNRNVGDKLQEGVNYSPVKVPLISAHQLFGLGEGYMQISLSGLSNVIPAYAPAYYQIDQCTERMRRNPYYRG